MTTDHKTIRDEVSAAWDWFHHNHAAYLQALVFVLSSISNAENDEVLKEKFAKLEKFTKGVSMSPQDYYRANLFYSQVSGLELFFQRVIRSLIAAYPAKIGSVQFRLAQIIEAPTLDSLIDQAADEYLNKLMYKKPAEYMGEVCSLLAIDENRLAGFWSAFVEAKARRDVGIHNNWICNDVYLRKIREVGLTPTVELGESLVPSTNDYMFNATDSLRAIAQEIYVAILEKYV